MRKIKYYENMFARMAADAKAKRSQFPAKSDSPTSTVSVDSAPTPSSKPLLSNEVGHKPEKVLQRVETVKGINRQPSIGQLAVPKKSAAAAPAGAGAGEVVKVPRVVKREGDGKKLKNGKDLKGKDKVPLKSLPRAAALKDGGNVDVDAKADANLGNGHGNVELVVKGSHSNKGAASKYKATANDSPGTASSFKSSSTIPPEAFPKRLRSSSSHSVRNSATHSATRSHSQPQSHSSSSSSSSSSTSPRGQTSSSAKTSSQKTAQSLQSSPSNTNRSNALIAAAADVVVVDEEEDDDDKSSRFTRTRRSLTLQTGDDTSSSAYETAASTSVASSSSASATSSIATTVSVPLVPELPLLDMTKVHAAADEEEEEEEEDDEDEDMAAAAHDDDADADAAGEADVDFQVLKSAEASGRKRMGSRRRKWARRRSVNHTVDNHVHGAGANGFISVPSIISSSSSDSAGLLTSARGVGGLAGMAAAGYQVGPRTITVQDAERMLSLYCRDFDLNAFQYMVTTGHVITKEGPQQKKQKDSFKDPPIYKPPLDPRRMAAQAKTSVITDDDCVASPEPPQNPLNMTFKSWLISSLANY